MRTTPSPQTPSAPASRPTAPSDGPPPAAARPAGAPPARHRGPPARASTPSPRTPARTSPPVVAGETASDPAADDRAGRSGRQPWAPGYCCRGYCCWGYCGGYCCGGYWGVAPAGGSCASCSAWALSTVIAKPQAVHCVLYRDADREERDEEERELRDQLQHGVRRRPVTVHAGQQHHRELLHRAARPKDDHVGSSAWVCSVSWRGRARRRCGRPRAAGPRPGRR